MSRVMGMPATSTSSASQPMTVASGRAAVSVRAATEMVSVAAKTGTGVVGVCGSLRKQSMRWMTPSIEVGCGRVSKHSGVRRSGCVKTSERGVQGPRYLPCRVGSLPWEVRREECSLYMEVRSRGPHGVTWGIAKAPGRFSVGWRSEGRQWGGGPKYPRGTESPQVQ